MGVYNSTHLNSLEVWAEIRYIGDPHGCTEIETYKMRYGSYAGIVYIGVLL